MTEIREKHMAEKVNPFTAIWLQTRKAVRYVIDAKSAGYAIALILLAGIGSGLMGMQSSGLNDSIPTWLILIGALLLFPVISLASAAVIAALYLVVGKLFKGTGTYMDLFKTTGAAMIPYIWLAPLLILWILVSPDTYFADPFAAAQPGGGAIAGAVLYGVGAMILAIWSIIIHSKAIGEAHRFSAWKGFFILMIPAVIFGLVIFGIVLLFIVLIAGATIYGG